MTFDELKIELEAIKRGGIKIEDTHIKNALKRAIQKIALKTTPLNLITRDKTKEVIRECEIDNHLISKSGYYIREPDIDSDSIDIDPKLLSVVIYLIAYEFAPIQEQNRLNNLAKDEINSYKWYLYEIANRDDFDIDLLIEPYTIAPAVIGNEYRFDRVFVNNLMGYILGRSIDSIRDRVYIKRFFDYADGNISDEAMRALDIYLYKITHNKIPIDSDSISV
jgi:hypothetical protein